jgi:ABC-2 type transport system ATP-binding protein
MDTAIEVRDLVIERGKRTVLHGFTCTIPRGSVTGLLGPSGSGKTTLMRAVVGVQRLRSGAVRVFGRPAGSPDLRARIGYQTQAPSVYRDLTVRENLRYFARVVRVETRRVTEVLEEVALADMADQLVGRLSGGQRARVSLGAALIGNPTLLVLDEPTVGLDPLLRKDLWQTFHRLADAGTTLLVSSHAMDEARRCTDLLLMREGRLVAAGAPQDIGEQAATEDLEEAFCRLVESSSLPVGGPV